MKTLLFLVPLYLLPLVVRSDVVLTILIFTFVLSILAIGFNVVFGGAGQLTMFHAAAFGIGSYVTFLSMQRFGISFWLGYLVAVLMVVVISIVIGWICFKFRLKEFYFAVVTLAFAELCRLVAMNWTSVTNGTLGMLVLEKPTVWLPGSGVVRIEQTIPWYFLTLVCLTGVLIFSVLLMRSWIGRNFSAIRLNEDLAQTLGIDTFRYKLLAFTISNVIASFAGALLRLLHRLYRTGLSCRDPVARRHRHGAAWRGVHDHGAGRRRAGPDLAAASDRAARGSSRRGLRHDPHPRHPADAAWNRRSLRRTVQGRVRAA